LKDPEEEETITQELPALVEKAEEVAGKCFEVTFGAATNLGRVRENNEDKFDFVEPEEGRLLLRRGRLYAVADGMGGHAAGQIAAEMALKALFDTYYSSTAEPAEEALRAGFRRANELVYRTAGAVPSREGMGTTLTAAALVGERLLVANLGDSRAYLVREGQVRQVTEDHSLVGEQVRQGVLTEGEAAASPFKNVITKCIGNSAEVEPDVFEEVLLSGDRVVLCSDGLSNLVSAEEIGEAAVRDAPSIAARRLVELANERGGPDNVTVVIVRVGGDAPLQSGGTGSRVPWLFLAGFAAALAVGALILLGLTWTR
jgi:protein phosphatase